MLNADVRRTPYVTYTVYLVVAVAAVYAALVDRISPPAQAAAYAALMVFPGMAVYLFVEREARWLPLALLACAASPVLVGAAAVFMMLAGMAPGQASRILIIVSVVFCAVAVGWNGRIRRDEGLSSRNLMTAAALTAVFMLLAGFLPLTREWMRYWSDAWFHGAVIAQIDRFGVPPEDPYFAGLPLQYMWFYHVVVLVVARGAGIDPMVVMPLLNLHGLVTFILATFLFSIGFRKRFVYGMLAVIVVMLGLNAVFWAFLPLKLVKSFMGEVRGWAEITRTFSPTPFDMERMKALLTIYHNQTFLIKKFIVSTPFSFGLGYLAAFWCGVLRSLSGDRLVPLVLTFVSAAGMLLFHPLVGFIMFAGILGGLLLTHLGRRRLLDYSIRRVLKLVGVMALGFLAVAPYLYHVMHFKETGQTLPFSITVQRTVGLVISCALVIVLAAFQIRRLVAERRVGSSVLLWATLSLFIVCNLILLPGSNVYDKPPFFVFFPLAVAGSWTFADRLARRHAAPRYKAKVLTVLLLLLLPVNALAMAYYFATPEQTWITPWEEKVAAWVRHETPRDALFIDSGDRVFLLIHGPRRYYWGREAYAVHWGYKESEMATRRHVRDNLYSAEALDKRSIASLGTVEEDVYIIVREGEAQVAGMEKFSKYPTLFEKAFSAGPITVLLVDRQACREFTAGQGVIE